MTTNNKRPATNAMILLLCSEPIIRAVMKEALEDAGYVVRATGDLGTAGDMIGGSQIEVRRADPAMSITVPGAGPSRAHVERRESRPAARTRAVVVEHRPLRPRF